MCMEAATMGIRRMMDRGAQIPLEKPARGYEDLCQYAEQGCTSAKSPMIFDNFCLYGGYGCEIRKSKEREEGDRK